MKDMMAWKANARSAAVSYRASRSQHWVVIWTHGCTAVVQSMTLDAIDCQGFAGGFTLGAVQAGFRLVGKREHPGAFGVASCEANRHLLGNDWQTEVSEPH